MYILFIILIRKIAFKVHAVRWFEVIYKKEDKRFIDQFVYPLIFIRDSDIKLQKY